MIKDRIASYFSEIIFDKTILMYINVVVIK